MGLWLKGDLLALLDEGRCIQKHLCKPNIQKPAPSLMVSMNQSTLSRLMVLMLKLMLRWMHMPA